MSADLVLKDPVRKLLRIEGGATLPVTERRSCLITEEQIRAALAVAYDIPFRSVVSVESNVGPVLRVEWAP